ncbi:MAG: DUF1573 domain-containing protein [Chloroflexi bacterium]|nr:DUF1573 domain-containing protein [Chloroflexota bacterium]
MKRVLILAPLLLLVGLLAACSSEAGGSANGTPRIAVDKETLDFGYVHLQQWVRPVFQVRNDGDGNLRIQRATVTTIEGC